MSRQTGRRAGAPDTRDEILQAARHVFGELGYDRATIRGIAARADVDPSLIYHYFAAKSDLFAASIDLPFAPTQMLEASSAPNASDMGRRLAELFFSVWETEESRSSLLGILRSALAGEDQAVAAFRSFITDQMHVVIVPLIDTTDADLRAEMMASHLVGMAVTRYVVRLEPIASAPVEELVDLVAPRIQSYVDSRL